MKRSIGVTVSAVVALLGSLFLFGLGVLVIVAMALARPSAQQIRPLPKSFLIGMFVIVYLAPAVWGVVTGVGLFRLKNWARISMLIFSTLLVAMGCLSGLATALIPFPTPPGSNVNPGVATVVRFGLAGFWIVLAAVGTWWLVLFTRSSVKAQFASPSVVGVAGDPLQAGYGLVGLPAVSGRPLSITIIAWLLIVGCGFLVIGALLRTPAALFTVVLSGWQAGLLYSLFACVSLTVAIGLMRLKHWARSAAMAYLGFGLLNALVFYFSPGAADRMTALLDKQRALFPWLEPMPNSWQPVPTGMIVFGGIAGAIGTAIPIYFLMIHSKAFAEAGTTSIQSAPKTLL